MKNKREEVSESEESDNNKSHNNSSQKNYIDSSDEEVPRTPQKRMNLSPIKEFKQQNPDCTSYTLEDSIDRENDDVYLLELPKAIDVSWLMGKPINFEDITKLKLFKKKYLVEPINDGPQEINLQTRKLRSMPICKTFTIREYIKKKRSVDYGLENSTFKSDLPENLKIRHPLFGADYKNKVILEDSVLAKLDGLLQENTKKSKKKKNKKTKLVREEPVEDVNESIFGLLESHLKKKQKKHEVESLQEFEIPPASTKSKKSKKDNSYLEIAAEDNFVHHNNLRKTEKNKKDDNDAENAEEDNYVCYNRPNKSKKLKKGVSHTKLPAEDNSVYCNKPNKIEIFEKDVSHSEDIPVDYKKPHKTGKHKKDVSHAKIAAKDDSVYYKKRNKIEKRKKDDIPMQITSEDNSLYNKPNKREKYKNDDSQTQITSEENSYNKPNKREKHKNEDSQTEITSEDNSLYNKPNKREKHNNDDTQAQITSVVNSLYNKLDKTEKHKKDYDNTQITANDDSVYNNKPNKVEKQKQKKKSKERPFQIKIEPPSPPPCKKMRESTPGFANSTVLNLQLPLFDFDVSQIDSNPSASFTVKPKKVKKERRFSQNFSEFEDDLPKSKIKMKKEKMSDSLSNYGDDTKQFDDSIQRNLKVKKNKKKFDTSTSEFVNYSDTEPKSISNKKKKIKSEYISEAEEEQPKKKKRRVKSESQYLEDDDVMMNNILRNLKSEFAAESF